MLSKFCYFMYTTNLEYSEWHDTIDNSCLMKMLRFCISQMSFFMDFIIIALKSCCCCCCTMDNTPDTTHTKNVHCTNINVSYIYFNSKKKIVPIFGNLHFFLQCKINIYLCNDKNHNPYIRKKKIQ